MTEGILTFEEHAASLDACFMRIYQMGTLLISMGYREEGEQLQDDVLAARGHASEMWERTEIDTTEFDELIENMH